VSEVEGGTDAAVFVFVCTCAWSKGSSAAAWED
jgi:hypothetical protein